MAAIRLGTVTLVGGAAFVASALTQSVIFGFPHGGGFFAVLVAPVLVGLVVALGGAWFARLTRAEAMLAPLFAVGIAAGVLLLAYALVFHAFLPFHAAYVAMSWAVAAIPAVLAAALVPPRRPSNQPGLA